MPASLSLSDIGEGGIGGNDLLPPAEEPTVAVEEDDGVIGVERSEEDIEPEVAIVAVPPAAVDAVLVSLELRLVFDAVNEGVSRDSLAFGSSNLVYRPIDGLLITYVAPTSINQSPSRSSNKPMVRTYLMLPYCLPQFICNHIKHLLVVIRGDC